MKNEEQRWTYPKIVERARIDAVMDYMFGGTHQRRDGVNLFKKTTDVRDYEYNYDKFYAKEEAKEKAPKPGFRNKRGSRG